jgi:UDPglucose 6-dehydrogenase
MKIGVYGLWHLGAVTAACLAQAGFETIGIDAEPGLAESLAKGMPPLFEPGLEDILRDGLASARLSFTSDLKRAAETDLLWVTFDTPVDNDDRADVESVTRSIAAIFPYLRDGAVVLVSSQLPVGSTAALSRQFGEVAAGRAVSFAYSPENLRLGKALEAFRSPERIIVGARDQQAREMVDPVLRRFCERILWMSVESAEMTKHAVNAFLATCVVFANELATVCEEVGASAAEVERGLRSEPRIGAKAYVRAGAAFAGGTLARDIRFIGDLGRRHGVIMPMLEAVLASNNAHRSWAFNRLVGRLGSPQGKVVAVLGLAYKPGTDALRRSLGVELCLRLAEKGALVRAFDPKVRAWPKDLDLPIPLASSAMAALDGADAAVIATEWSEFRELSADDVASRMRAALVIDPNGFLPAPLREDRRIDCVTVGTAR